MAKELIEINCPCCSKRIEIDLRAGTARAIRPEEKAGGKDLDGLLAEQKHEQDRLKNTFDKATDQQKRQQERLEDLFTQAKQEAKKEKGERPRNPFDLD